MTYNVLGNRFLIIVVYLSLLIQDGSCRLFGGKRLAVHKLGANHSVGKTREIRTTSTSTTIVTSVLTEAIEANKTIGTNNESAMQTTILIPLKMEVTEANDIKTDVIKAHSKKPRMRKLKLHTTTTSTLPFQSEVIEANDYLSNVIEVSESAAETTVTVPRVPVKIEAKETSKTTVKAKKVSKTSVRMATKTVTLSTAHETTEDYVDDMQTILVELENFPAENVMEGASEGVGKHDDDLEPKPGNAEDVNADTDLEETEKSLEQTIEEQAVLKEIDDKLSADLQPISTTAGDIRQSLVVDSHDLDRKIEIIAIELMSFSADGINVTAPTTEVNIETAKGNETFTQRFVYVPATFRLEIPCSAGMPTQSPFSNFWWSREKVKMKFKGGRVKVGPKKELIFEEVDPMDSGRYNCRHRVNKDSYTNLVYLHVFVPADVAVGFPFTFKAALCNRNEYLTIQNQIKEIFCSSFQYCSFDFSATCHVTPWFGQENNPDPLPAVLQVLVIKYTNPNYQPPICDTHCVMQAKLENILSEMLTLAEAYKKVGESVRRIGHCPSSNCASDYVFVPHATYTESTVLYVCDAGYVVYRRSACVPCFPGEFATTRSWKEECERCPGLTYQPDPGANTCIPCKIRAAGSLVTGATSSDICKDEKGGLSGKAVIGLICLIVILSILGILVIIVVVMCCRESAPTSATKEKSLVRRPQDSAAVAVATAASAAAGEKEPLQPGKKENAPDGLAPRKVGAFWIARKPTKASSLGSAVPGKNASNRVSHRRAADFPSDAAGSKRVSSSRAQQIESAPNFGRQPAKTSSFARPSRTPASSKTAGASKGSAASRTAAASKTAAATDPIRPETAVRTQAAPAPARVSESGKVTKIEPLTPVNARPVSAAIVAPTAVTSVTPFVSNPASTAGSESARSKTTGRVSFSDTSYKTFSSNSPEVSESRQTQLGRTASPADKEPTLTSSTAATSTTKSGVSQVSFVTPLSSSTPMISESRQTPKSTNTESALTSSTAMTSSTAVTSPVIASSDASQLSFKSPLSSITPTVSESRQTPKSAISLPSNTAPALTPSATLTSPTIAPSAASQVSFRSPLSSIAPTASESRETPKSATSFNLNSALTPASSPSMASPAVSQAVVLQTPLKVAGTGSATTPKTVFPATLNLRPSSLPGRTTVSFTESVPESYASTVDQPKSEGTPAALTTPTPSASGALASAAPSLVASASDAVPDQQQSQNVNQSSRSHPSIMSWWNLGSATSGGPSATHLPLANSETHRMLSNIQLHVLRTRPEHEVTRSVANAVSRAASLDSRSSKTSKGSAAANLKSSPIASPTVARGERPYAGALQRVDATPSAESIGTENTTNQNLKFQTKPIGRAAGAIAASPLTNNSVISRDSKHSELLWTEENLDLWRSYEVTELDNLVDGADDELVSEQAPTVLESKKQRTWNLFKR